MNASCNSACQRQTQGIKIDLVSINRVVCTELLCMSLFPVANKEAELFLLHNCLQSINRETKREGQGLDGRKMLK
jgi:hypothetical protein